MDLSPLRVDRRNLCSMEHASILRQRSSTTLRIVASVEVREWLARLSCQHVAFPIRQVLPRGQQKEVPDAGSEAFEMVVCRGERALNSVSAQTFSLPARQCCYTLAPRSWQ